VPLPVFLCDDRGWRWTLSQRAGAALARKRRAGWVGRDRRGLTKRTTAGDGERNLMNLTMTVVFDPMTVSAKDVKAALLTAGIKEESIKLSTTRTKAAKVAK